MLAKIFMNYNLTPTRVLKNIAPAEPPLKMFYPWVAKPGKGVGLLLTGYRFPAPNFFVLFNI